MELVLEFVQVIAILVLLHAREDAKVDVKDVILNVEPLVVV